MSRKPENTFIGSIHKHLPVKLHREKMANPYRGGTADCWYSGSKRDLWIEYKFIERIPREVPIKVELSTLQLDWLRGRFHEGRNVAVIVGCKAGGVVFRNLEWENSPSPAAFTAALMTRSELAQWILSEAGEPNDQVELGNLQSPGRRTPGRRTRASDLRGSVPETGSQRPGRKR